MQADSPLEAFDQEAILEQTPADRTRIRRGKDLTPVLPSFRIPITYVSRSPQGFGNGKKSRIRSLY